MKYQEINLYHSSEDGEKQFGEKQFIAQEQKGYAAYMIIGSYYHDCSFYSRMQELHLLIQYKELPEPRQFSVERGIEEQFLRACYDVLPFLSRMRSECFFLRKEDTLTVYFLTGGFEPVSVHIDAELHVTIELEE